MLKQVDRKSRYIAFDPNIRPSLWRNADEMRLWIMAGASLASTAFPSFEDEAELFGDVDLDETASRYRAAGVEEVVVKDGRRPALLVNASQRSTISAQPVAKVVDATGAGDSFNGAYLANRLLGKTAQDALVAAHRAAASCIAGHGALVSATNTP
jgi:2-dehydro-3-deoxygluconokinase